MSERGEAELCEEVMRRARDTLLVNLRFLDIALSRLKPISNELISFGTDGVYLAYRPHYLLRRYVDDARVTVRDYLHALLHCVFGHSFVDGSIERGLWNLSCDIAVENTINDLGLTAARHPKQDEQCRVCAEMGEVTLTAERLYRFFRVNPPDARKFARLSALFSADDHALWYLTAEQKAAMGIGEEQSQISGAARKEPDGEEADQDRAQDTPDVQDARQADSGEQTDGDSASQSPAQGARNARQADSGEQTDGDSASQSPAQGARNVQRADTGDQTDGDRASIDGDARNRLLAREWKEIARRVQLEIEGFGKGRGDSPGGMLQNLREVNRERYDYTEFLKKFAVMGEVMKINDDEFDTVYYTYGLKLYGNVPLIEPLEYKEVKRIREFVIAIDTSGSVAGDLVQTFLQKTYNILKQTDSFFSRVNLHILQCDAKIQEHVKITNQREFDAYLRSMKIRGLGGTDFRPVFEEVERLNQAHEFNNLKGMIYFTDGDGEYPSKKPPYRTAFVFVDDEDRVPEVPAWAIRLVLRKDEIAR